MDLLTESQQMVLENQISEKFLNLMEKTFGDSSWKVQDRYSAIIFDCIREELSYRQNYPLVKIPVGKYAMKAFMFRYIQ